MRLFRKIFSGAGIHRGIAVVFLVVCLFIGVSSLQYYTRLQNTIQRESRSVLQELATKTGSNINRIIDDNYASLNTLAAALHSMQVQSFPQLGLLAQAQKSHWNSRDLLFISESGKAYSAGGREIALESNADFERALVAKEQGLYTTQMIENQECIVLAVPLEGIVLDDIAMTAVAASYDPAVFEQTLSMSSFDGQAFSFIISKTGTVIIRSTSGSSLKTGYNVLTTVGGAHMDGSKGFDTVKADIANDVAGQLTFTLDGVQYYMAYTPINPRDWYLLTFVPSAAVNEHSNALLRVTLLLCGLITLAFAGMIALLVYLFYRNKRKLEQIAYVDTVTGGNTIQRFYELAQALVTTPGHSPYALVYTNLAKFKVLNEQFGRSACDGMLYRLYDIVNSDLQPGECMGRHAADNFCVLLHYRGEDDLVARFRGWHAAVERSVAQRNVPWGVPGAAFGVYIIADDHEPFPQMIDRAKLAMRQQPRALNSRLCYAVYNDALRRQMFREKQLEDMMDASLKSGEFQVYLQPKYSLPTRTIGGAEALTRWVSKSEGMIFPDEFIPLFEKNGFIVQLDLYVFEQVCIALRKWLDAGFTPMRISVNCSRIHLKSASFLQPYIALAEQYSIPRKLLEIELTESVVIEDSDRLTRVIDEIHAAGFACSMDDFGSGYSSLNLIQSIAVDTLKLDKIFFRSRAQDPARLASVVGSIISMARALSMTTVAEGVEYPEQIEMLERIGCDFIQGYVFAKPMPLEAFEALAFGEAEKGAQPL